MTKALAIFSLLFSLSAISATNQDDKFISQVETNDTSSNAISSVVRLDTVIDGNLKIRVAFARNDYDADINAGQLIITIPIPELSGDAIFKYDGKIQSVTSVTIENSQLVVRALAVADTGKVDKVVTLRFRYLNDEGRVLVGNQIVLQK